MKTIIGSKWSAANTAVCQGDVMLAAVMMMIAVLRPLLCTWYIKWAEQPPNVMKSKMKQHSDMSTPRFEHGY